MCVFQRILHDKFESACTSFGRQNRWIKNRKSEDVNMKFVRGKVWLYWNVVANAFGVDTWHARILYVHYTISVPWLFILSCERFMWKDANTKSFVWHLVWSSMHRSWKMHEITNEKKTNGLRIGDAPWEVECDSRCLGIMSLGSLVRAG